jgi:site-specific DNA-methyltransferase (adenine-specific)
MASCGGTMIDLRLGDCLEVMKALPDGCVDAVVTDPPWTNYQTGRYDASAWHKPVKLVAPNLYCPDISRIIRPGGAALIWCRWDTFPVLADSIHSADMEVRNCVVWDKGNHTAGDLNGNFGNCHEMAAFAVKGKWHRPGAREENLWRVTHLFSKTKRYHPTEKPVSLMKRSVEALTYPGQIVIDPFMGSGTTGVACVKTGRSFIGIEEDPTYFAIAEKRITEAQQQLSLLTEMT